MSIEQFGCAIAAASATSISNVSRFIANSFRIRDYARRGDGTRWRNTTGPMPRIAAFRAVCYARVGREYDVRERPRKNIKIRNVKRPPADAELIALPKGSIDPGEKPEETALREVREETGVRADMVTKLADIKYIYVRNWGDRAKVFKIVSFYLLMYRTGRLGNIAPAMRIEVQNAFWLPLEEAPHKLSYKGEREMAERARSEEHTSE